jgi:hypothetical protein
MFDLEPANVNMNNMFGGKHRRHRHRHTKTKQLMGGKKMRRTNGRHKRGGFMGAMQDALVPVALTLGLLKYNKRLTNKKKTHKVKYNK